jgi:hypothetical protein
MISGFHHCVRFALSLGFYTAQNPERVQYLKQSITVTDYEFASLQVNFNVFAHMLYKRVNLEVCCV